MYPAAESEQNSPVRVIQNNTCDHRERSENLARILDRIANEYPQMTAIKEGRGRRSRSISYESLLTAVKNRASELIGNGVKNGDRVLLLQSMSTELYINILALFRIGASALIVDIASGLHVLDHAVGLVKPNAVIAAGPGLLLGLTFGSVRTIQVKLSCGLTPPGWIDLSKTDTSPEEEDYKEAELLSQKEESSSFARIERVYSDTPALITFTSGSGGKPRAIVRTHGFLKEQLKVLESTAEMQPGTCELTSLPIFVLANLASCVTTVIPDSKQSNPAGIKGKRMVEQLVSGDADRILGSPSFIDNIVEYCEKRKMALPQIDTVLTGGGPVFPSLLDRCKKVFPNARLFTVYGSTEAEPISKVEFSALSESDSHLIANGAGLPVGKPVDGIEVRILPVETGENHIGRNRRFAAFQHICDVAGVPFNRLGEIIVTGNHVVKGYYHGLGDSSSKITIDGKKWHRTGDFGYFDNHGRLWLIGRNQKEDNLDTTFSYAVEAAALSRPSIKRAAFVARPESSFLFIESQANEPGVENSHALLDFIGWAEVTSVRRTNRIPLDTRHNTKVLYNRLPTP